MQLAGRGINHREHDEKTITDRLGRNSRAIFDLVKYGNGSNRTLGYFIIK